MHEFLILALGFMFHERLSETKGETFLSPEAGNLRIGVFDHFPIQLAFVVTHSFLKELLHVLALAQLEIQDG